MKAVYLPSDLRKGDVIDVRIQFPTGQDYILLSKKNIDRLQNPAFWTTLSEQEILLLSSALVDAYLHEATIYALTYVEPQLQEKAILTYPPNAEVTKLIASNPNIVKTAEKQLELTLRSTLEDDLSKLSPEQQIQVSDVHVQSSYEGVKSPDAWSSAYKAAPSAIAASAAEPPNVSPDNGEYPGTPFREERDAEAEQILGTSGVANAQPGEDSESLDPDAIFSSP